MATTARTDDRTVLPPADMHAMLDLSRFLEHHAEAAALLGPDGEQVPLPMEVYGILVKVVDAMRAGRAITLAPLERRLTIQQAADLLGISRQAAEDSLYEASAEDCREALERVRHTD